MVPSWVPEPRRGVFCVGRNDHAHAKELQTSVFMHNDANLETWPTNWTKVPDCAV